MIKAIIFDLDNTLYWDERSNDEALEATCHVASNNVSTISAHKLKHDVIREAEQQFKASLFFDFAHSLEITALETLWARFDVENNSMFDMMRTQAPIYRFNVWNAALQSSGHVDPDLASLLATRYLQERRERAFIYEDLFETLTLLRSKYRLLLLTNGTPDLQQEKIDSVPELASFFEHIVISGDFGVGKPSEAIFHHAIDLLALELSEVVMVGDNLYTDILGANRSGIPSIWINRSNSSKPEHIFPTHEVMSLTELYPLILSLS
ncbi:HAD family hydrolase [Paenibacillus sp. Marseille-Q4541]|uniref:HAD family hydrolase n=1 Tax=Paenibacillus sp. Marseille-Q4541 TaxID=2831522 RepID=UPI001BACCC15|nr:HAD family hydrolase [Paenibacillus sp. Marseille-Q4541]